MGQPILFLTTDHNEVFDVDNLEFDRRSFMNLARQPSSVSRMLCVVFITAVIGGCSDTHSNAPLSGDVEGLNSSVVPVATVPNPENMDTPFITPGLRKPKTYAVNEVTIPDDARVFGVIVGNERRAYLRDAMSSMSSHIVNDLFTQTPVSISYCDRTECLRAFIGDPTGEPMDLCIGGFMNNEMAIRLDGVMYEQSSDKIPLQSFEVIKTVWGDWKSLHPETLVVIGNLEARYLPAPVATQDASDLKEM